MSMIFYYHLFIGEVRTIRNETTYSIHGKYPLNQVRNLRNLNLLKKDRPSLFFSAHSEKSFTGFAAMPKNVYFCT